uniref:SCP domain-containing protein n=1 Tax=Syphacia muris TaxID=451379 RepID=A0A0N5AIY1_9BILA
MPIAEKKRYIQLSCLRNPFICKGCGIYCKNGNIEYHNIYRRLHGAAPLDYDDRIESYARNWSDKLVNRFACIEHDPMRRYGENIFFYAATVLPNESALARMALHSFYTESNGYDYKTGHFTQLIWKNTKRLGIGVSIGHWLNQYANNCMPKFPAFVVYVVVKYDPPGNIHKLDYYNQNVSPKPIKL